jgi:hypothetical protein
MLWTDRACVNHYDNPTEAAPSSWAIPSFIYGNVVLVICLKDPSRRRLKQGVGRSMFLDERYLHDNPTAVDPI